MIFWIIHIELIPPLEAYISKLIEHKDEKLFQGYTSKMLIFILFQKLAEIEEHYFDIIITNKIIVLLGKFLEYKSSLDTAILEELNIF